MAACQSQTEQAPVAPTENEALQTSSHDVAIPDTNMPLPARQAVETSQASTKQPDKTASLILKKRVSPPATKPATKSTLTLQKTASTVTARAGHQLARTKNSIKVDMKVLNKCKSCHSLTAKAKVGPGLGKGNGIPGVFDRKAGTFPGFRYKFTKYIKPGKAWVWDEAHLRQWECDSRKAIKIFTGDAKARTKMPPQHICDPDKQDAMIAALRSIS